MCYRSSVLSFILLFLFIFILNQPANAADKLDGTLKLTPAYLEVTLDQPNQAKNIKLYLTNNSQHQVMLQLFPIDFKQQEPDGITTFIGQGENYSYSLASFLSFDNDTLVLDPGEKKLFSVQVTNRKDVSPGGHYAAVVAKMVTNNPGDNSTHLSPAVSSLIYLRKTGGEKFSMFLKDVSWPRNKVVLNYSPDMELTFQNEGNVHIIPYGLIQITDILNTVLYKGIINTSSARILPETRRNIEVALSKVHSSWPISVNTVTIDGHDSLGKVKYTYKHRFLYINPLFILFIIIVGYILLTQLKKRKK